MKKRNKLYFSARSKNCASWVLRQTNKPGLMKWKTPHIMIKYKWNVPCLVLKHYRLHHCTAHIIYTIKYTHTNEYIFRSGRINDMIFWEESEILSEIRDIDLSIFRIPPRRKYFKSWNLIISTKMTSQHNHHFVVTFTLWCS